MDVGPIEQHGQPAQLVGVDEPDGPGPAGPRVWSWSGPHGGGHRRMCVRRVDPERSARAGRARRRRRPSGRRRRPGGGRRRPARSRPRGLPLLGRRQERGVRVGRTREQAAWPAATSACPSKRPSPPSVSGQSPDRTSRRRRSRPRRRSQSTSTRRRLGRARLSCQTDVSVPAPPSANADRPAIDVLDAVDAVEVSARGADADDRPDEEPSMSRSWIECSSSVPAPGLGDCRPARSSRSALDRDVLVVAEDDRHHPPGVGLRRGGGPRRTPGECRSIRPT